VSEIIQIKNEIQSLFQAAEFISETCAQINKDLLGLSEESIKQEDILQTANPLEQLIADLEPILAFLTDRGNLQQFIYKVDLSEKKYFQVLNGDDPNGLAFLIIRREAQKVFLKRKFR
jgi:hypothetical protein